MRFLHNDVVPIMDHLHRQKTDIRELEWELHPPVSGYSFLPWTIRRTNAKPPASASVADIEALDRFSRVPENAGTTQRIYFHMNAPLSDRAVSLDAAIEHVEAFGGPEEFLLAGYHDGGLISVSRYLLPFQENEKEVSAWWGTQSVWAAI